MDPRKILLDAQRPGIAALLEHGFTDTAGVLAGIDGSGWAVPSPCTGWTVRQVGNHLTGSIALLTRVVDGGPVEPAEFDGQRLADTDHLGADAVGSFRGVAERAVAAFARPDTLDRRFGYPQPDTPGVVLANICLLEALVHGWDVATGAGVGYRPDGTVVAAVREFTAMAIGDQQRRHGLFGPALAIGADADPLTATLAHLGREA